MANYEYKLHIKRYPLHTSLLKLAAQKWTQFAANNTELDLAKHGSYGPENGQKNT